MSDNLPPVVMVFAGTDPTGGAGVEADVQSLSALGCHPVPVITAISVQNTTGVIHIEPINTELVVAQARAILDDFSVAAFKTGILGTVNNLTAVSTIVNEYPDIPLVVDPVLASGAGDSLSIEPMEDAYRHMLLPAARLVTPNTSETRRLAPDADSLDACAQKLMSLGCDYVLHTGCHEPTPDVVHVLYGQYRRMETFHQERLNHDYHGSGCTLASACAGAIAQGFDITTAIREALDFTWNSLANAHALGRGQHLPERLYWARRASPLRRRR